MRTHGERQIAEWIAVSLPTAALSFWAFWGIIENYCEGWHSL
ncbi:MAG: hypothetical protein PVF85_07465 [Anaerolineales bacterium]|jgi:hypothetical protein